MNTRTLEIPIFTFIIYTSIILISLLLRYLMLVQLVICNSKRTISGNKTEVLLFRHSFNSSLHPVFLFSFVLANLSKIFLGSLAC